MRQIARRGAEQRQQGEGTQAGDAAFALLGLALLALDADQRPEQNGGGEIEREVEQLLIFHRAGSATSRGWASYAKTALNNLNPIRKSASL